MGQKRCFNWAKKNILTKINSGSALLLIDAAVPLYFGNHF